MGSVIDIFSWSLNGELTSNVKVVKKSALWDNDITKLNLPYATSIGDYGFEECSLLTEVNLPNVETIWEGAFEYCSKLTTVNAPKLKTIGEWVFEGAASLTQMNFPELKHILSYAFEGCYIKHLTLPKVELIQSYAFCGNEHLIDIEANAITSIDAYAFETCELESATFNSLIKLGEYAFESCPNLRAFVAPKLQFIGDYAFDYCPELKEVNFPEAVYLGDGAFTEAGLTKAHFPKVKTVEAYSFCYCADLTALRLDAVEQIGGTYTNPDDIFGGFKGCASLATLILSNPDTVCKYVADASYDPPNTNLKIYVPRALLNSYKTATNWVRLADKFVAIEDYPNILNEV